MPFRRTLWRKIAAAAVAATVLTPGVAASDTAGGTRCAGTFTATADPSPVAGPVAAHDVCLADGWFYEARFAGWHLVAGLGERNEPFAGRAGFARLSSPEGTAWALVATEAPDGTLEFAVAEGGVEPDGGFAGREIGGDPGQDAVWHLQVAGAPADLWEAPGPVAEQLRALVRDAIAAATN